MKRNGREGPLAVAAVLGPPRGLGGWGPGLFLTPDTSWLVVGTTWGRAGGRFSPTERWDHLCERGESVRVCSLERKGGKMREGREEGTHPTK